MPRGRRRSLRQDNPIFFSIIPHAAERTEIGSADSRTSQCLSIVKSLARLVLKKSGDFDHLPPIE
jgi:hypothetical protein